MGYSKWAWNLESKDTDIHALDYLNKILIETFKDPNYITQQKLQVYESK